jgi:hypothetical protein
MGFADFGAAPNAGGTQPPAAGADNVFAANFGNFQPPSQGKNEGSGGDIFAANF